MAIDLEPAILGIVHQLNAFELLSARGQLVHHAPYRHGMVLPQSGEVELGLRRHFRGSKPSGCYERRKRGIQMTCFSSNLNRFSPKELFGGDGVIEEDAQRIVVNERGWREETREENVRSGKWDVYERLENVNK